MATYSNIAGQEPSTVTFKVATVQISRGTTAEQQEILVIGDPATSNAQAAVVAATPASNSFGLVTRPIFSSTAADNPVSVSGTVTVQGNSTVLQGTSPWVIGGNSTVLQGTSPWTIAGNTTIAFPAGMVSTAAPASGDTGLTVRQVGYVAPTTNVVVTGTVTVQGNSTVLQGTSPWTIGGNTTIAFPAGMTSTGAPATGDTGLFVRQIGYVAPTTNVTISAGNSSVIVTSGNSSVTISAGNSSVTITAGNSSVTVSAFAAGMVSTSAPSSNSTGIIVRHVVDSILVASSSNAFASSSFTVASSAANVRVYVQGYSILTTVAGSQSVKFYAGSTMVWPMVFATPSSAVSGANLAVSCPAYLFRGDVGGAVTLQTASSGAGWKVAVSYFVGP